MVVGTVQVSQWQCKSGSVYTESQKKVGDFYFCDNFGKWTDFHNFLTVTFEKDLQRKLQLELAPPVHTAAVLPCEMLSGQLYSFTDIVNSVQNDAKMFDDSKYSRDAIHCLSL